MAGPGLMLVGTHIIDTNSLSEADFNRWYNEEQLQRVIDTGLQGSATVALRYKNIKPNAQLPYLALFPMDDYSKATSKEAAAFRLIVDKSEMLQCDDIQKLISFDRRLYEKMRTNENPNHEDKERGDTILAITVEPKEGTEHEFERQMRDEPLDMLNQLHGYRRSTAWKRVDGVKPRYVALHEFDCSQEKLPYPEIEQILGFVRSMSDTCEDNVFELIQRRGKATVQL